DEADRYLGPVNDFARRLMTKLWPGPVALMFNVPDDRRAAVSGEMKIDQAVIYDGATITLRCPDHIVTTDVIAGAQTPIVLTRAGSDAEQPARLAQELEGKVDLILDAGAPRYSKVSTILRVRENGYEIVRAGIYD